MIQSLSLFVDSVTDDGPRVCECVCVSSEPALAFEGFCMALIWCAQVSHSADLSSRYAGMGTARGALCLCILVLAASPQQQCQESSGARQPPALGGSGSLADDAMLGRVLPRILCLVVIGCDHTATHVCSRGSGSCPAHTATMSLVKDITAVCTALRLWHVWRRAAPTVAPSRYGCIACLVIFSQPRSCMLLRKFCQLHWRV